MTKIFKFANKFIRFITYTVSLFLRFVLPVRKGRVLLWATLGKDYGCNPMYISKYLVKNEPYFDVWWMFRKGIEIKGLDFREKVCLYGSLKYLYILNTAEFIITNHRTRPRDFYWKKKRSQKYIMTWHGSMPIKKVEKDAIEALPEEYVKMAKMDSLNCDLMLSDSAFFTNLIRNSFFYEGEILKTSLPRNYKFYEKNGFKKYREKVLSYFNLNNSLDNLIVLYAPTFRDNNSVEQYITNWDKIKTAFETKYHKEVIILVRLHPNLLNTIDTNDLIQSNYVKNASIYGDMQELMVASDVLITDYSSTMFEFSMMNKPCFLYMPDLDIYNRGFYFNIQDLPFARSTDVPSLISDIIKYDNEIYGNRIKTFIRREFNLYDVSEGCVELSKWMHKHSVS